MILTIERVTSPRAKELFALYRAAVGKDDRAEAYWAGFYDGFIEGHSSPVAYHPPGLTHIYNLGREDGAYEHNEDTQDIR